MLPCRIWIRELGVVCLEKSNYRGPSPLRLELGEHELTLKRLKFDRNVMRGQWPDSSTCVGPSRRDVWDPGNTHPWEAHCETPAGGDHSKTNRMVEASSKVAVYAVSLRCASCLGQEGENHSMNKGPG